MSPNKRNENVERQIELRRQGIDEDHAARIAGTDQDNPSIGQTPPEARKWWKKQKTEKRPQNHNH